MNKLQFSIFGASTSLKHTLEQGNLEVPFVQAQFEELNHALCLLQMRS